MAAGGETVEPAETSETRCEAVLENGERCKREGKSIFDERSGMSLYYCFVHRKRLWANGRLVRQVPGASAEASQTPTVS